MERYAFVLALLVACGGDDSEPLTSDAAPSLDSTVAADARQNDGATDAGPLPDDVPQHLVLARGVAGEETLTLVDGATSQVISSGPGQAICGGKLYCNLPPNGAMGRFLLRRQLNGHLVFLQADAFSWDQSQVIGVDLATGVRSVLSEGVTWPAVTPDWWLHFTVDAQVAGGALWISLPVEGGTALFRTDGATPLELVASLPTPPGMDYMESLVRASDAGVAWTVRSRSTGAGDYEYHALLLDAAGELQERLPEDLAAGVALLDTVQLGGDRAIALVGKNGTRQVLRLGLGDGSVVELASDPMIYVWDRLVSPDGLRVVLGIAGEDGGRVVSTDDGSSLDELAEHPVAFTSETLLLVASVEGQSGLRDLITHSTLELTPDDGQGWFGFNQTSVLLTPEWVVSLVGAPFLELWENVGVARIARADGSITYLEPAGTTEDFTRQLRLSSDGRWALYLTPVGQVLQLAAVELATGRKLVLTSGSPSVRDFEVLPD